MSTPATQADFDSERFEPVLVQLAECDITDLELEGFLRRCELWACSSESSWNETHARRLRTAIHAFCHIEGIIRRYRDEDVDLDTSRRLVAKGKRGERYSDEELRLLGKRSSIREADANLEHAFLGVIGAAYPDEFSNKLDEKQLKVASESLLEQAVARGTHGVTTKAEYAERVSKCSAMTMRLYIAHRISWYAEHTCCFGKRAWGRIFGDIRERMRFHAPVGGGVATGRPHSPWRSQLGAVAARVAR